MSQEIQGTGNQVGSCSGVCKKWFADRGFGFIEKQPKDPSEGDIFVHFTGIKGDDRKSLNIGENVTFDMGEDAKSGKPRAENVVGDGTGTASEDLYPSKTKLTSLRHNLTNPFPHAQTTFTHTNHFFSQQPQQPYSFNHSNYNPSYYQHQTTQQFAQTPGQSYGTSYGSNSAFPSQFHSYV